MRPFIIVATILCSVVLVIPSILVLAFSGDDQSNSEKGASQQRNLSTQSYQEVISPEHDIAVAVFRTQKQAIENVPLEEYIVGVIASEMPASFELEALKAQALTARTYIVKQMLNPIDIELPDGAMVTDTVSHQVYRNLDELKELWDQDYEWKLARITEAVASTSGQILTYDSQPITATFFSTSNGHTENSEDYWQSQIPYLRSVESPWDEASPRFKGQKTFSKSEFEQLLGVSLPSNGTVGKIKARTSGGRVATVDINGVEFTGREIREKLDLESSDFSWSRKGDSIVIDTKGWGHGVGMSQYGADGMAKEGKTYKDIVTHYFQGVEIETIDPFVAAMTENQVARAE